MLDEQVVRATLKSCNLLASALDRPLGSHSNYLQLLRTPDQSNRPVISATMWQDYATIIYLLEWRAALAVESAAQNLEHPDAGINHRLSKAVTEAFVATRVGIMVSDLNQLPQNEANALKDLYLLVRPCHSAKLASLFTPIIICSTCWSPRRRPWPISLHSGYSNVGLTRRIRHETLAQPSTPSVFVFSQMLLCSPTRFPSPTGHWIGSFVSI